MFGTNEVRRLPVFAHDEIAPGAELGEGEFSLVREIKRFKIADKCNCIIHDSESAATGPGNLDVRVLECSPSTIDGVTWDDDCLDDSADDKDDNTRNEGRNEDRGFMKHHCFRDGSARYAIKQLKPIAAPEAQADAIIDLAMEAKFLAVLSHPNIIKMRATGGTPCHLKYFIVLDRLYDTLEERIDFWATEKKKLMGFLGLLGKRKSDLQQLFCDRLLAALDIARAMKYLHSHSIIFRDLKPENIVRQ